MLAQLDRREGKGIGVKVVVLGSSGQIGSALCRHLEACGHSVFHSDIEEGAFYDMSNAETLPFLKDQLEWADFVFFLAFDVGGSRYLAEHQKSVDFLSTNVRIMDNFATAMQKAQSAPDFLFASSQMSNMLHSQYGVLKRLGEFYTTALGGINVRFWNVFGNEHVPEKFHVVTDFINTARQRQPIVMRTDGREVRQMLHADDAAVALRVLLDRARELDRSKYFDVTSFEWVTIKEIGDYIAQVYEVSCHRGEKTDDVQLDARNEPTDEIKKYWTPDLPLEEGILRVIHDMENT